MNKGAALVLVDIETTGLSIVSDVIIEVAVLPVGADLVPLDTGWSVVVNWGQYSPILMNEHVREMHTANGLLDEVPHGLWPKEAADQLLRYLEDFADPGTLPMTGSSIHFDRKFCEFQMPTFENWFHYRCVDVSTVKQLWRLWFPELGEPPKVKAHRALADCRESLAELVWYRDSLMLDITSAFQPN